MTESHEWEMQQGIAQIREELATMRARTEAVSEAVAVHHALNGHDGMYEKMTIVQTDLVALKVQLEPIFEQYRQSQAKESLLKTSFGKVSIAAMIGAALATASEKFLHIFGK